MAIFSRAPSRPFSTLVATDSVPDIDNAFIGGDSDVINTTYSTIWPEGGTYVFPTSASTMTVSSDSANDTSTGTGAIAVQITYLDSSYVQATEVVVLNGTTAVTTSASIFRINQVLVISSGSSDHNEGIIYVGTGTVTAGKPENVFAIISATFSLTNSAVYTIPADKSLNIINVVTATEANKFVSLRFMLFQDATGTTVTLPLVTSSTGSFQFESRIATATSAKSDISFTAVVATGTASVGLQVFSYLINQEA